MHGMQNKMSTIVILVMLAIVFMLIDPVAVIMLGLLGLLVYGYLKSK
jgi:hypothetical protein